VTPRYGQQEAQRSPTASTWAGTVSGRASLLSRAGTAWHGRSGKWQYTGAAAVAHTLNGRGCTRCTITNGIVRHSRRGLLAGMTRSTVLVWWSAQTGRRPLGRAQKVRFTTPQTAARNQPACPLLKTFFRCAGQIAAPIGTASFFMGEARRKRLQVSTKGTETLSSPRRLRNSRRRSSILNEAGAASGSALEQRLLPLLHTPSGRG